MRYLLILLFLIPASLAQPGCGEYCGDYGEYEYGDYEGGCVHAVEWDDGANQIVYEYAYVCDGEVEAVEFIFETAGQPEFLLEAAMVSGNRGSVVAMELQVEIGAIVLFEDQDGDRAFHPEKDEVLELDDFDGDRWGRIQAEEAGNGVRYHADYELAFGGTFRVAAEARGESYKAGGFRVNPTDTKIDFEFHDMSYPTETSQVAIVLLIGSEVASVSGGTPRGIQSGEQGIAIGGGQSAYFTWAKTAVVDGKMRPVYAIDETERSRESVSGNGANVEAYEAFGAVTLAYAQGADIVHDPRLGVAFSQGNKDAPVPIWLGFAAFAAVALLRRR